MGEPLFGAHEDKCDALERDDDKVDLLNREIRFYLARLGQDRMSPQQAHRRMQLINVCSDLEGIGDVVTRSLVAMARKKTAKGVSFSEEGRKELMAFHAQVADVQDMAVSAFASSDEELGRRAERLIAQTQADEASLRRSHIERLHRSERATIESSSIHLDVLSDLSRVASMLASLVDAAERPRGPQAGAA